MIRPSPAAAALRRALPALAAACLAAGAQADPADYVFIPYTTAGERVLAYAAGLAHDRDGGGREAQQTASLGWAPTARWFTSVYAGWTSEDGAGYVFDEASWLNHVQLAAPGAWPVDVGVLCELERPRDRDEGTGLTCGPTFELDTDRFQFDLNPLLEKHFGAADPEPASLAYQWQAKRLVGRGLELGAQGFGDLGPWNHWAGQSHTLGPVVFMKWPLADGHTLQLDAGVQFGLGAGAPRDVLRRRVQHEF
jgi:hypothetical protein